MRNKHIQLSLIASISRATDSLGLYRAELARILGLMCADVSIPGNLELLINTDIHCRRRAELLVKFHLLLEEHFPDNTAAMQNWFRKEHASLCTSPFLAIVDDGRIDTVIELLIHHEPT